MVRPLELNQSRNIYYFPVVTNTDSNTIKIIPLESSNAYVSSSSYVDASGNSTHPDIFSFISQVGIEEAPNYGNFTFEYLLKYSSTDGVVVSSNNFNTATQDISFIPDNTKDYYTGTIQNRFITFTNLAGNSTTFKEYQNRQLNNFIAETVLEETGDRCFVKITEICKANTDFTVKLEKQDNFCEVFGFIAFNRTASRECEFTFEEGKDEFTTWGECYFSLPKYWGKDIHSEKITYKKFNNTKDRDSFKCDGYVTTKSAGIRFEKSAADGKIKSEIFGNIGISADKVVGGGPSVGLSIFEAAVGGLATIIAASVTLPAGAAIGAAGSVLPEGKLKDSVNVVADPAGSIVKIGFDVLNNSLTTKFKDLVDDFNKKLDIALRGIECSKDGEIKLKELLTTKTPVGVALANVADQLDSVIKDCPCSEFQSFKA